MNHSLVRKLTRRDLADFRHRLDISWDDSVGSNHSTSTFRASLQDAGAVVHGRAILNRYRLVNYFVELRV